MMAMDGVVGCKIDDLVLELASNIEDAGRSRRTLQNDLKKLSDLGYVAWQKQGNARVYGLTLNGKTVLQGLEE